MNFKKVCISILFFTNYSTAWQVIPMQKAPESQEEPTRDATKSFHFPVHAHFDLGVDRLIVTAQHDNQAKHFALSFYDFLENVFKPLAREKVKLNGVADQKNPFFDAGIEHIALIDDTLVASLTSAPKKIVAMALSDYKEVLEGPVITDDKGNEMEGRITSLAGGDKRIFVATARNIIVFEVRSETKDVALTDEEFETLKNRLQAEDDEKAIEQITKEITVKDGKRTRKVTEKKFVQLSNTAFESEVADMHWNVNLKRLFIALKAKEDHCMADAYKNLLVAYCEENGRLVTNQVYAPHVTNNFYHSIEKIKSIFTTTSLDYLVVVEGKGNVFAIPVLNFHTQDGTIAADKIALQGTVADPLGMPFEGFSTIDRAYTFLGRHFITPAQSACEDRCMQVGGGRLGIGTIDQIFVRDDAVYVIVNNPDEGFDAGIYYSHAIFDEYGRISAWTKWKPKSLIDGTITNAYVDRLNGCLTVAAANDEREVRTIKRTQWINNQLTELVKQEFPQSLGGLHGLIDFSSITPGINQHMIACLGVGKLLLACPENQMRSLVFNDEVLKKLGPLSCAEIAYNHPYGYLFAGGVHGLGVLCTPDGLGWHYSAIDENFTDTLSSLRCKQIGDYSFVRKIIADEQFVYVLTDTVFDRIDLTASDLESGRLYTTCLASAQQLQESDLGIFIDAVVSEKFAVIITTTGLHRIGNGCDIRNDSIETLKWTPLQLHDKAGPSISLIPISTTGRMQDLARDAGQLYVISGSINNNTARVHRFAVSTVINKATDDKTIMPVRDFAAENHLSYFANIGNFTSLFATDGTLFLTQGMQRDRKRNKTQIINNNFGKYRRKMPLALSKDAIITCIARNSASGNWMIGGNFGLIVNE